MPLDRPLSIRVLTCSSCCIDLTPQGSVQRLPRPRQMGSRGAFATAHGFGDLLDQQVHPLIGGDGLALPMGFTSSSPGATLPPTERAAPPARTWRMNL